MAALRIIFMGTPDLARVTLQALLRCPDFEVVAAVTQPDRPKGRELKLRPSPVKVLSLESNIQVLQPDRVRDEAFIGLLRSLNPDLIVVAAYGRILPAGILELPPFGCLNVHTSLLPKYRGAAPIQWAILNDEPETGVTIMKMDAGMDTGDILRQQPTPIQTADTAITLHDRLAAMGAGLLVDTISDYTAGKIPPRPQPALGVSYARKIEKEDGQINWRRPARVIWNQVRGLVPWPGAFTKLPGSNGPVLLKIWNSEVVDLKGEPGEIISATRSGIVVGCGTEALRVLELQREGGRRLSAQEFLTGHALGPGQRLGEEV